MAVYFLKPLFNRMVVVGRCVAERAGEEIIEIKAMVGGEVQLRMDAMLKL